MGRLLNEFAERVVKTDNSFDLVIKESERKDTRYYQFFQSKVGNGRFVYGSYGFNEDFYISFDKEPKLVAIVADGVVFIIDKWFFDMWQEQATLPANTECFYKTSVASINERFCNVIFPIFYNTLESAQLTDSDCAQCANIARNIMLSRKEVLKEVKPNNGFGEWDVAKILCGLMDFEDSANKRLEADRADWSLDKAKYEKTKEYIETSFGVEEWELRLAEGLRSVSAKAVTVEFEYNGNKAVGKIDPDRITRILIDRDNIDDWDFITRTQGEQIFAILGASRYHRDENALRCKHISRITYGKKELYVRNT